MRVAWLCSGVVLAAGALAAAGCGGSGSNTTGTASGGAQSLRGQTIEVSTWGGVWTDAEKKYFGDPFTKATGIKVQYVPSSSTPTAPALLQEQSGNVKLDIVETENAEILKGKGYLADFPADLTATLQRTARADAFTNNLIRLGNTATLIVCNPDVMQRCPTNPQEFWDTKGFPGPRAIVNEANFALEFALEADGVPPSQLFPLDIPRGIAKMNEIKPAVKVFPSSGSEQQQVMINKEVGAAIMWNGRAFVVKRDNIPNLKFFWDGSIIAGSSGNVVLKDAPHQAAAFAYLKWILEHPKAQAAWSNELTYPTPTKQLLDLVPKDTAAALPTSHHPTSQDDAWLAAHQTDLEKAWHGFLAG